MPDRITADRAGSSVLRSQRVTDSDDSASLWTDTKIEGREFYSPSSEIDLVALVAGASALLPDLLPFVIRDYDARFGFDALAARNKELAISETKHLFVEFKLDLKPNFDHTFENLDSIVCWESRVKDGQEMRDLAGKAGAYRITTDHDGTKQRFIMVEGSPRNVAVIVFPELLKQRDYLFKPPGE